MILELLLKDFRRLHPKKKSKFKGASFFRVLFTFIGVVALEAILVYIYQGVDKKIEAYAEGSSFAIMVFFLGLYGIFLTVNGALKARKILFDESDREILFTLPIPDFNYLFSKMIYVYLSLFIECSLFSLPILCTYINLRGLSMYYFAGSLLYPLTMCIFYTGMAFILSLLLQFIYLRIKDNDLVQFILASLLMLLLCVAYYYFLNLFLVTLQDGSINGVISPEFVSTLNNILIIFTPGYNFLDMFITGNFGATNISLMAGLLLFSMLVGYVATKLLFRSEKLNAFYRTEKEEEEKEPTLRYGFRNLIKKELSILFKDSSNTFSYTSLLILLPFLSYAVISSFNVIFERNYTLILTYYPELFRLINLALILLFIGSINASSSMSMSNEKAGLMVTKVLPASLKKMFFAKILAPSALSFGSYLLAVLVLLISGEITFLLFLSSLALGLILILVQSILGMLLDMKDKGGKGSKKVALLNSLLPFIAPILILAIGIPMSLNSFTSGVIYLTIIAVSLALSALNLIGIGKRMKKAFYEMEVR